ncbi:hypothetical protein CASFOL_007822 [Castilleja foliolosa]|uniref:Uncharacterized protein n=1 Tax=Castilleja foliolosa TaxID=1961234 RepID=A0ABD3E1L7_9LAMI
MRCHKFICFSVTKFLVSIQIKLDVVGDPISRSRVRVFRRKKVKNEEMGVSQI